MKVLFNLRNFVATQDLRTELGIKCGAMEQWAKEILARKGSLAEFSQEDVVTELMAQTFLMLTKRLDAIHEIVIEPDTTPEDALRQLRAFHERASIDHTGWYYTSGNNAELDTDDDELELLELLRKDDNALLRAFYEAANDEELLIYIKDVREMWRTVATAAEEEYLKTVDKARAMAEIAIGKSN